MKDLIERQAAIDALREAENHAFNSFYKGLVKAHKIIADMPSAQPEPQWVPCSEQLPEEDGDYLVLYYTRSKFKPYTYDVMSFANDLYQIDEYNFIDRRGQKGWFYYDREYGFCEDNSVYAWMPLPEPYMRNE